MSKLRKEMKETARHYRKNRESRRKRLAYQKEYNKRPDQVKKRVELNRANRRSQAAGKTKKHDGLDKSHTKSGGLVNEKASRNRARNRGKK